MSKYIDEFAKTYPTIKKIKETTESMKKPLFKPLPNSKKVKIVKI